MGTLRRILPSILILVVLFSSFLGTSFAEEESSTSDSELKWTFEKVNDGIDNFIYLEKSAEDSNYRWNEITIYCQKKVLTAYIGVDFADESGWKGVARIRHDSKPVKNLSYTVTRDRESIYINSPKVFVSEILKSKKFIIKIGTIDGYKTSTYYTSDLQSYKKQFSAKGCKLG